MHYDLDDLRLFVHVVAEGSITAGARHMHLSLPSASARIRGLEQQAGIELLRRGRRGVRPTPAGATLARHAQEVLRQTARLDSAVAGYRAAVTAPLVLLAGGSAMHRLVPAALTSFLAARPHVDVDVAESRTPRTIQALVAGRADLGIVLDDEAGSSGLRLDRLGDDSLVAIGPVGGVLDGRSAITYREMAEHPLVGLHPDSSLRGWIDRHLGPEAPVVRYRTTVTDVGVLIALAAAGVGLAIAPRRAIGLGLPLVQCALDEPWARRRHLLAWGVRDEPTVETAALAEHLQLAARHDAASYDPDAQGANPMLRRAPDPMLRRAPEVTP